MYKVEIKTLNSSIFFEQDEFIQALQWAGSIALSEEITHGKLKSIEIFDEDRLVASLRTVK